MTTIELPWPPKGLQPHSKGSWRPKAEATRRYRRDAYYVARAANVQPCPGAVLTFTYHPPDLRRRDVQNMPAMLKAAIDGIADAMGHDDHGFRPRFPEAFAEPRKGGQIVVTVSEGVA